MKENENEVGKEKGKDRNEKMTVEIFHNNKHVCQVILTDMSNVE